MRPDWRRSPTLSIDRTGTYTLQATDGTRVISSNTFVIGPGTSSSITVVAGNGQSAAVTTNYASQLKVSVQDALGNGVPGIVVTFAAPSSGASVTFSGPATVTTGIGGVAAISVTANTQVGAFEVTASAPGTAAPAVFSLTNVAGSASHLAFVQQPSGAAAGAVIAPPVTVQLTDSIGNNVAQAGVAVTLTLNPAAGRLAAITGTTTVATRCQRSGELPRSEHCHRGQLSAHRRRNLSGVGAEQRLHDNGGPGDHHHGQRGKPAEHDRSGALRGAAAGAGERFRRQPAERRGGQPSPRPPSERRRRCRPRRPRPMPAAMPV